MKEAIRKRLQLYRNHQSCPTLYGRRNRLGDRLEMMQFYKANSTIQNGADTRDAVLDFKGKILCGKFVDRERPSFLENYNTKMAERLGSSFKSYEGVL
jgi:2-oxoglutarate ferredoxin oxidoreductase subunit beta